MDEPEAPSPPDGGPRPPDRDPAKAEEPEPPFPPRMVTVTFET
jgi:hypothetical protein